MIGKLSKRITIALINQKQIDKGDAALYEYGIFVLFSNLVFLLISCLAGALFGVFWQSLLFFIAFRFIRRYAGGYHASAEWRCQISSAVSIVASVLLIRFFQQDARLLLWAVLAALGTVVIVLFSPLDTPAKPLSAAERRAYKKKTVLILAVLDIAFVLSAVLRWEFLYLPVAVAIGLETVLLTLGKIQQTVQRKHP